MSIRQPARSEERPVGAGADAGQDGVCQWLSPLLVGRFEFLEWTGENHLRHSKFIGLSEGKNPKDVVRE